MSSFHFNLVNKLLYSVLISSNFAFKCLNAKLSFFKIELSNAGLPKSAGYFF